MKTSDLDAMDFKLDEWGRDVVNDGGKWTPYGRVLAWCRFMGRFRKYGDWTVQETCSSAACRGTVRARLSGPRGTVEAWNCREVLYVPKGVKPSKAPWPECRDEDEANGVVWWKELPWRRGQPVSEVNDHFARCVDEACAMAGIQEAML